MIKECKYCKQEFEAVNNRGSEKLYCSKICRNKSANKRFQENLIKKIKNNENEKEEISNGNGSVGMLQGNVSEYEKNNKGFSEGIFKNENSHDYNFNIISQLEKTYAARNEVLFYKLKCEALEKEIVELKDEIMNLENELDEFNQDENEGMGGNIIGGLVNSFKNDPQSTLQFATEMINNFVKPKIVKNA